MDPPLATLLYSTLQQVFGCLLPDRAPAGGACPGGRDGTSRMNRDVLPSYIIRTCRLVVAGALDARERLSSLYKVSSSACLQIPIM